MKEPTHRSHETNTTTPDFQKQIDAITDRALTPEDIEGYADRALNDLIAVVESVTDTYGDLPQPLVLTQSGQEAAMMRYAGLDSDVIESTLDHIANISQTINQLDGIVKRLTENPISEHVPPSTSNPRIEPGNGAFEKNDLFHG